MSEVPNGLKYTKSHEWLYHQSDGNVKVGITDYAQASLSDVVFLELPAVGSQFSAGDPMAVAESVKAASDIYAPISGKVVQINQKLEESPELVNESPYDSGWIVVLHPTDDIESLLDSKSYSEIID